MPVHKIYYRWQAITIIYIYLFITTEQRDH